MAHMIGFAVDVNEEGKGKQTVKVGKNRKCVRCKGQAKR